jgi:hypothetical protein
VRALQWPRFKKRSTLKTKGEAVMKRWTHRPEGSNWGDFGEDDQKGRINLITPEIRLKAAAEIKNGISFCLSLPLDYPGGNALIKARQQPRLFTVRREGGQVNYNFPWRALTCQHDHLDVTCDDAVTLYTQYSTQWDALCHYGQFFDADGDGEAEKVYYNGFSSRRWKAATNRAPRRSASRTLLRPARKGAGSWSTFTRSMAAIISRSATTT